VNRNVKEQAAGCVFARTCFRICLPTFRDLFVMSIPRPNVKMRKKEKKRYLQISTTKPRHFSSKYFSSFHSLSLIDVDNNIYYIIRCSERERERRRDLNDKRVDLDLTSSR